MPDINLLLHLLTKFAWLGNWLFFTLAFIESAPFIGVFLPGATLISIGGFLASQGLLNVWDIIFFATIGAILGDVVSYALGRWGGNWIKNKKIINHNILNHGEKFFKKYGNKSIFLGRFFGPIRAIIPFIAGISKMKEGSFIFWNVLSSIGWAMLNVFAGYFSGTLIISIFKKWSGRLSLILILVIVIFIFYWIIKKKGKSIKTSFCINSVNFVNYLKNRKWFNKLLIKYPFISEFINESKNAAEKIFGGILIFTLLTIIYFLIIILDIF
ncbi:MAG TPA: DedA family protein [Candidatus Paceibacterota bacterium]